MAKRKRGDRRIRYGLGPGGAVYLLVAVLILIASIYTQANLLFSAFGLMVGGLIVSVALSWRALRGLNVQRLPPAHGVAGQPLVLRYQLVNKSWQPLFGLMVHESWGRGSEGWKRVGPVVERPTVLRAPPRGWVLHMGPNQSAQAEAVCWPMRRGEVSFETIVLSTSFPFGILRKTLIIRQEQSVMVYPQLYRINRRLIGRLSSVEVAGMNATDRRGGHDEFYGLRDYRPGDSLRQIDWRRTARTGELVSREMTKPSPPRMMVLLDLSHAPPPEPPAKRRSRRKPRWNDPRPPLPEAIALEEAAICLAASLVCDGYLHGFQIGLAVKGPPCPVYLPHHSLPHRAKLFEALAGLIPARRDRNPAPPSVTPSVIVTTLDASADAARQRPDAPVVLSAARIDDYILDGDTADLLSRRVQPKSRRQAVAADQQDLVMADGGRG